MLTVEINTKFDKNLPSSVEDGTCRWIDRESKCTAEFQIMDTGWSVVCVRTIPLLVNLK
jgi:hypothetical protein